MSRSHSHRPLIALTSALLGLGLCSPALGQNALGDGGALDNNPQVGSGGRNRATPQDSYRARNLLVTGNVAGGRGFRDTVGYEAAGDFRGQLGSDDLFTFRAQSALSDLSYVSTGRGFNAFAAGQSFGMFEIQRRSGVASSLDTLDSDQLRYLDSISAVAEARADRILTADDDLRGLTNERSPEIVSMFAGPDGTRYRASSSTIRGIQFEEMSSDATLLGLSIYDGARLLDDARAGELDESPGAAFETDFDQYRVSDQVMPNDPENARVEVERLHGDYGEIVQRMITRLEPEIDETQATPGQTIQEQIEELQQRLQGDEGQLPDEPLIPGRSDETGEDEGEEEGDEETGLIDPETGLPANDGQIPLVLKHGTVVDDLGDGGEDRFNELLDEGQASLRQGQFFQAERRFVRALRIHPNHPLVIGGLANAQIGAGLHLAAANTLRDLFLRHPEMIDVTYDAGLLPGGSRIKGLTEALTDEISSKIAGSEQALVLAYLGHQAENRDAITLGLDHMEGVDADDPLVPILRGIWLRPDEGAADDAEQSDAETDDADPDDNPDLDQEIDDLHEAADDILEGDG